MDELKAPQAVFPNDPGFADAVKQFQAESDKIIAAGVAANSVNTAPKGSDPNSTEPKPHDPVGAIQENLVLSNDLLAGKIPVPTAKEEQNKTEPARVNHNYLLNSSKIKKIEAILKNKGMDSQQVQQSIREIEAILNK